MTSVILDLVRKSAAERKLRAELVEADRERMRRAYAQKMEPEVRAILGPLANECDLGVEEVAPGASGYIRFRVVPQVWKGLVTFILVKGEEEKCWRFSGRTNELVYAPEDWTTKRELVRSLGELHQLFEQRRDQRISDALARLARTDTADDEAMRCRLDLIDLAPERGNEWAMAFAAWVERREARAAAERERAAAFDAYIEALAAWRREYEQALEANRQAVRDIQIDLDAEFTRYEVTYAAVGDEDDYPSEARAWTLDEFPDERGYRRLFEDDGRVARRRLMRALWVGEPITQRVLGAGPGPWRMGVYAVWAGTFVYCLPWDAATARNLIEQHTKRLPGQPAAWSFDGDGGMTAEERRRIGEALDGMENIDF